MLLTGTLDFTDISCNYLEKMRTEHLIAWGMAHRILNSNKGFMTFHLCRVHTRIKSPLSKEEKKEETASRIWYEVLKLC
jgi:hypothetical protein